MKEIPKRFFYEKLIAIILIFQFPLIFLIVATGNFYLLLVGVLGIPIFFAGKTDVVDQDEIYRILDAFSEVESARESYLNSKCGPINLFSPILEMESEIGIDRFPEAYYSVYASDLRLVGGVSFDEQVSRMGGESEVESKYELVAESINQIKPILQSALDKEERRQKGHMV